MLKKQNTVRYSANNHVLLEYSLSQQPCKTHHKPDVNVSF